MTLCYWTKLGSVHLHPVKPVCWHGVVVKASTVFISEPSKEYGQLMLKGPKLPEGFQGRDFKGQMRKRSRSAWPAHGAGGVVTTFWFQLVWGFHACGQPLVNFFHLVRVSLCKIAQDIIYSPWGRTKDPWLCLMAKVSLFCLAWLF